MMRIGIISDTHSHLDRSVLQHFTNCDEIWHGGDIGELSLLRELRAFKPTIAVFGNIDPADIRSETPENQFIERGGLKILITHIAGKPPWYTNRVKSLVLKLKPDVLVCGHSHILKVQPDKQNKLLYINPGAAGVQGFHTVKTILRLEINDGKLQNLEAIELGKRGKI